MRRFSLLLFALVGCTTELDVDETAIAVDDIPLPEADALPAVAIDATPARQPDAAVDRCGIARPAIDWRPADGELDGRDWTEVELAASSENPDISWWIVTVDGPVDQVRLAPPVYLDEPAYRHDWDYAGLIEECDGATTIRAWFYPGIYTVEVSYLDGRLAELFTLYAGSKVNGPSAGGTGGPVEPKDSPNCRNYAEYSQIPWDWLAADKGAFIIEEGGPDNTYIERSVKVMQGRDSTRAGDVATAAQKLVDAYNAKGSAVNAVIVGHGANTNLSIGAGTGWAEGKNLFMTGTKTNDALKAKVSDKGVQRVKRLAMVSCCVAGRLRELVKDHLVCDLAQGLAPGGSVTEIAAFDARTNNVVASDHRDSYFTVAGNKWWLHAWQVKKGHCDDWKPIPPPK